MNALLDKKEATQVLVGFIFYNISAMTIYSVKTTFWTKRILRVVN